MRYKLLIMCVTVMSLSACTARQSQFLLNQDKRVDVAQNLEQKGSVNDALVQWQIMQTLYPSHPEILSNIDRLQNKIEAQKEKLLKSLSALQKDPQDSTKAKRKTLMLKALALTPNDLSIKESLRDMVWDQALEEASEKNQTIVKYFEENQKKAQESIQLTGYLEQGESFIESKKYNGLLQLADKLNKISPKHKDVTRFKFIALNSLGEHALTAQENASAIAYFEKAIVVANQQQKQSLVKKVADLRNGLATGYFAQGQRMFNRDLAEAIRLFKQALAVDSTYQKAKQQLLRAEKMRANLLKIQRLND